MNPNPIVVAFSFIMCTVFFTVSMLVYGCYVSPPPGGKKSNLEDCKIENITILRNTQVLHQVSLQLRSGTIMSEGHDEDLSTAALLSASVSPLDYGSTKGDEQDYPSSNGYSLDPTGLAMVVSSSQFGALDAFNGVDGLASAINCGSISLGLSSDLIAYQRERYGSNETPTPSVPSLLELYVEQIKDPTLVMLLCSAVISLILGLGIERDFEHGWIEGTSILCTVFLVISVSAWTDYLKAIAFRDQLLELESEKHVDVIRSGLSVQLHPNELVVGDVMRLAVGDISPVDGVLVDGTDIKFDESALTGESELIGKTAYKRKGDRSGDPFVISGT